jgi:hypothetical protein
MKLTIQQNKEIIDNLEDVFRPALERYSEMDSDREYLDVPDVESELKEGVLEILKIVGFETNFNTKMSMLDIIDDVECGKSVPEDFSELEEVDEEDDYEREYKYCYVTTIFKYVPDGTFHAFEEQ